MGELQEKTVCTTHHLQAFLQIQPIAGIDLAWLRNAIVERGGEVHNSALPVPKDLDPLQEACLRLTWLHWFYPDRLASGAPNMHNIARENFQNRHVVASTCPKLQALLAVLFGEGATTQRQREPMQSLI
jgi:hypothetical protein